MKYRLISSWSEYCFNQTMEALVKEGWKPHGDLVVTPLPPRTGGWQPTAEISQMMVLQEPEEKTP